MVPMMGQAVYAVMVKRYRKLLLWKLPKMLGSRRSDECGDIRWKRFQGMSCELQAECRVGHTEVPAGLIDVV